MWKVQTLKLLQMWLLKDCRLQRWRTSLNTSLQKVKLFTRANVRYHSVLGTTVYKDVFGTRFQPTLQTEGIFEIKGQLVGSHLTVSSQVVAGNNIETMDVVLTASSCIWWWWFGEWLDSFKSQYRCQESLDYRRKHTDDWASILFGIRDLTNVVDNLLLPMVIGQEYVELCWSRNSRSANG